MSYIKRIILVAQPDAVRHTLDFKHPLKDLVLWGLFLQENTDKRVHFELQLNDEFNIEFDLLGDNACFMRFISGEMKSEWVFVNSAYANSAYTAAEKMGVFFQPKGFVETPVLDADGVALTDALPEIDFEEIRHETAVGNGPTEYELEIFIDGEYAGSLIAAFELLPPVTNPFGEEEEEFRCVVRFEEPSVDIEE